MLTGDDPATTRACASGWRALGFEDFVAYVAWCCERALERGILPHTNLGALPREDLARLREVTASQGLMLESMRPDLVAHQGSPDEGPGAAARDDPRGRRAPHPVHERDPRGDRRDARPTASRRSRRWPAVHAEHGHLQEVILQNFVPHRRYYGEEPAEIAEETQRSGDAPGALELPSWATEVDARPHARARARAPAADAGRGHPDPAEPVGPGGCRWWTRAPRTSAGCRRTATTSPRAPLPVRARDAQAARAARAGAGRAAVRLPAVHERGLARAGRARRHQGEVLVVHPPERVGPPGGATDPARARAGRRRAGRGRRGAVRGGAHRAVRRDAPRGDRGHAPGGRLAAR